MILWGPIVAKVETLMKVTLHFVCHLDNCHLQLCHGTFGMISNRISDQMDLGIA